MAARRQGLAAGLCAVLALLGACSPTTTKPAPQTETSAAPEVTVDRGSIEDWLTNSDEGQGNIEVHSNADVAQLMRDVDRLTQAFMDVETTPFAMSRSVPMPGGAALWVDWVDDREAFGRALDEMATDLQAAGYTATIRYFKDDYPPVALAEHRIDAVRAGMSLRGKPRSPRGDSFVERSRWTPDPGSLNHVLHRTLDWCAEDGDQIYFSADLASSKVDRSEADRLLPLAVGKAWVDITCADSTDVVRRAAFLDDGHVVLSLGGDHPPPGATEAAELRDMLVLLHEDIDYAFIDRGHVAGRLWRDLNREFWDEATSDTMPSEPITRSDERRRVVNVYGIQMLGPGHTLADLPPRWKVTDLGAGRRLVEVVTPAPWFEQRPSRALKVTARQEFGALAIPTWAP